MLRRNGSDVSLPITPENMSLARRSALHVTGNRQAIYTVAKKPLSELI